MYAPVDSIRKLASVHRGRVAFDHYAEGDVDLVDAMRLKKMAHADQGLLKIAAWCDTSDSLEMYELLGGEFTKEAISAGLVSKTLQKAVAGGASPQRLSQFAGKMERGARKVHGQMTARGPATTQSPGMLGKLMGKKPVTSPGARVHERGSQAWNQKQRQMAVRSGAAGQARKVMGQTPQRSAGSAPVAQIRQATQKQRRLPEGLPAMFNAA